MSLKLGMPNMAPSHPCEDEEREIRNAIVQDTGETSAKDRDLVHGDGGTFELNDDDLNKDD